MLWTFVARKIMAWRPGLLQSEMMGNDFGIGQNLVGLFLASITVRRMKHFRSLPGENILCS
jgi:hypothetical protein